MTYEAPLHTWMPRSFSEIINEVISYLPEYEPTARVEFVLPNDLLVVKASDNLSTAFVSLVATRVGFFKFETLISVTEVQDQWLTAQVKRKFNEGITLSSVDFDNMPSQVSEPSPLAIAASIIRRHGSELQIHPTEEGVTFEFQLPIWKD